MVCFGGDYNTSDFFNNVLFWLMEMETEMSVRKSEYIEVSLEPIGETLKVKTGTSLIDILHEYGVEFPCGGKGTCGSCKIKVLKGDIPVSEKHKRSLYNLGLSENWRLACMSKVSEDVTLEISQFDTIILADTSSFMFKPKSGFGVAVDLGTTTLVAQLLDLQSGHVLNVATALNPQAKYGADVISRIEYALKDGNLDKLRDMIREKIGEMVNDLIKGHDSGINNVVIVGNTVMHHLFCGLNVQPLSFYPFESPETNRKRFHSSELGWDIDDEAEISFMPSIGSFVGSDILAGIVASNIYHSDGYTALVDLGTNGEIVIGNKDQILCASTAAGPAFEGTNITMGMRASTGAVASVRNTKNGISCDVIGNEVPRGICGSGLIDAAAVLLKNNLMDEWGGFQDGREYVPLTGDVRVYQGDIREFQLAKSALASGLQILMNYLGISSKNVDQLYIAGGFGNYINIANTTRLGMLEFNKNKIVKLGNTALIGAKMFLFMDSQEVESLLKIIRHVPLEGDPNFQDIFIDKMQF